VLRGSLVGNIGGERGCVRGNPLRGWRLGEDDFCAQPGRVHRAHSSGESIRRIYRRLIGAPRRCHVRQRTSDSRRVGDGALPCALSRHGKIPW
jgi:hypothetical protein